MMASTAVLKPRQNVLGMLGERTNPGGVHRVPPVSLFDLPGNGPEQ